MIFFPKRAKDSRKIDNIALKDLDILDIYPPVLNCNALHQNKCMRLGIQKTQRN